MGGMCMMVMGEPLNMTVTPQEPTIMQLEQTLLWFKMVNMDPLWESMLGTDEWYQLIESMEESLETLKNQ